MLEEHLRFVFRHSGFVFLSVLNRLHKENRLDEGPYLARILSPVIVSSRPTWFLLDVPAATGVIFRYGVRNPRLRSLSKADSRSVRRFLFLSLLSGLICSTPKMEYIIKGVVGKLDNIIWDSQIKVTIYLTFPGKLDKMLRILGKVR